MLQFDGSIFNENIAKLVLDNAVCEKLKAVSTTFLLICFGYLKESFCETRKNVFYFTSKAFLVLEIIKF